MEEKMFCRQCEQPAGGKVCTVVGLCGKSPQAAALMDKIIYLLQGISIYGSKLRKKGIVSSETDRLIIEALYSTVTNVDFDPGRLKEIAEKCAQQLNKLKDEFVRTYPEYDISKLPEPALRTVESDVNINNQELKAGILNGANDDIRSLKEILLYGLKGMAAYADHAMILDKKDQQVNSFFYKGLSAIADSNISSDTLINLILEFGNVNLKCMEMLDGAHTEKFGHPEPTKVFLGAKKGYAIAISGHDLFDLEQLLQQTENTGINIYTHG
ncbi:MAG: hydroxylamine reductase, partial [Candidatus Omnitrophica bacterium]|nr:hydroxylamine reductase [Candidatus Omnitrophota bacterium]